eukprot:TRINITY_DN5628_c0_g1_i2.p1 TRINITY_DN5628_c0_g1~~TRINITY_DN5628_c0_g1_i2.p1  ORF type:complete len:660 (+),score=133.89 TRINITY_DN5628_c0_g1_i2:55-2034(+)
MKVKVVLFFVAFGAFALCGDPPSTNINSEGELLIYKMEKDPLGSIDSYATLTEEQKQKYFSFDDGTSWTKKIKLLRDMELVTYVDVKLVGFEQDGEEAIVLKEIDFKRFFESTEEAPRIQVLNEEKTKMTSMPMISQTFHQVIHARKSLASSIATAIAPHLTTSIQTTNGEAYSIPYDVVDKLLEKDYGDQSTTYTIYILNVKRPDSARNISYDYYTQIAPSSSKLRNCGVGIRAHATKRFLWIDLNAGPFRYGPKTIGEGLVTPRAIPQVSVYMQGSNNEFAKQAFVADLVALVRKTSNLLFTPPMKYSHDHLRGAKRYVFYHIYDDEALKNSPSFRYEDLKKQAKQLSMPLETPAEFEVKHVNLYDCQWCMSSLSASTKTFTSVVFLSELTTRVHQYIDSKELLYWIEFFMESRNSPLFEEYRASPETVIPIFLFDFSTTDVLLLDRFHQSVSNNNIIVAVQTRTGRVALDFQCDDATIYLDSTDATRAVLGSVLETAYGIAPSYSLWDAAHHTAHVDYLWCIGKTPFGYFSTENDLSFVYKDLASRTNVYSLFNSTLSSLGDLFVKFASYGESIEDVLDPPEYVEFLRRWNIFYFKLQKAGLYLSLNKYARYEVLYPYRHDLVIKSVGKSACDFILETFNESVQSQKENQESVRNS